MCFLDPIFVTHSEHYVLHRFLRNVNEIVLNFWPVPHLWPQTFCLVSIMIRAVRWFWKWVQMFNNGLTVSLKCTMWQTIVVLIIGYFTPLSKPVPQTRLKGNNLSFVHAISQNLGTYSGEFDGYRKWTGWSHHRVPCSKILRLQDIIQRFPSNA